MSLLRRLLRHALGRKERADKAEVSLFPQEDQSTAHPRHRRGPTGVSEVEGLIEALRNEEDSKTRVKAVEDLGSLGDERAMEPLIDALGDADRVVRRRAAKALEALGDQRAVGPLIRCLDDEDSKVRAISVKSLISIGGDSVAEALIGVLKDPSRDVRRNAVHGLASLGDSRAVPALYDLLGDESDDVREKTAIALGRLGQTQTVPYLMELLGVGSLEATEALVEIGEPALESLVQALKDGDPAVRRLTSWALGRIGNVTAVDSLAAALEDEDEDVMHAAAEALERIGGPEAGAALTGYRDQAQREEIQRLIDRLGFGNEDIAEEACRCLEKIGARAVEFLVPALGHWDHLVRMYSAEVLGRIGEPAAIGPLTRILDDENPYLVLRAAEALWRLGDPSAVPSVIRLLGHPDQRPRQCAAETLGRVGEDRAVGPLIEALADQDEAVRSAVEEALEKIGGPDAETALRDYRAEQERQEAAEEAERMERRRREREEFKRRAGEKGTCPNCGSPLKMEKITEYVSGVRCRSCGWASVLCHACDAGWMTATPEVIRPDVPLQATLECDLCGKFSRADYEIIAWLKRRKYPGFH